MRYLILNDPLILQPNPNQRDYVFCPILPGPLCNNIIALVSQNLLQSLTCGLVSQCSYEVTIYYAAFDLSNFLKCRTTKDTAEGVIPGILVAWDTVVGLI